MEAGVARRLQYHGQSHPKKNPLIQNGSSVLQLDNDLWLYQDRILWGCSVDLESMGQSHALYTINKRQNLNYNIIISLRIL